MIDSTGQVASSVPPWLEPVRGGHPDDAFFGLSGIEQLRASLAGHSPRPPIAHLFGSRFIEVGVGSAVFEMPLSEWLCGPQRAVSIGALAIPADAALGCPVQSGLPPATPLATSELSLRVLAPARLGTSVVARGRLLHARRSLALSEVSLIDGNGRTLAHGSSLCFILPPLSPPPEPPSELKPVEQTHYDTPDPWARPPEGTILSQDVWDRASGLEVLRARITDELPEPPIKRLTGLRPTAAAEGAATFTLPATEWLCAPPRGRVQGGAVALLADAALGAAIGTTLPAGTAFAPVDLKVNYLRPLASDGREATARGTVLHSGRRIAVASAEVRNADDKPVALATGSAIILPGRAAAFASVEDPYRLTGGGAAGLEE
jgi:uncharacterized protein (TIGR00369 family)